MTMDLIGDSGMKMIRSSCSYYEVGAFIKRQCVHSARCVYVYV